MPLALPPVIMLASPAGTLPLQNFSIMTADIVFEIPSAKWNFRASNFKANSGMPKFQVKSKDVVRVRRLSNCAAGFILPVPTLSNVLSSRLRVGALLELQV